MLFDQKRYINFSLDAYLMAAILKNENFLSESDLVIKQMGDFSHTLSENFGSNLRDKAFMLLLHARHFEKNDFSDELADYLIKRVNDAVSTQERAFISIALRVF